MPALWDGVRANDPASRSLAKLRSGKGSLLAVSTKLEIFSNGRRSTAVHVDGRWGKSGLTEAAANALLSRLLNEQFAARRL